MQQSEMARCVSADALHTGCRVLTVCGTVRRRHTCANAASMSYELSPCKLKASEVPAVRSAHYISRTLSACSHCLVHPPAPCFKLPCLRLGRRDQRAAYQRGTSAWTGLAQAQTDRRRGTHPATYVAGTGMPVGVTAQLVMELHGAGLVSGPREPDRQRPSTLTYMAGSPLLGSRPICTSLLCARAAARAGSTALRAERCGWLHTASTRNKRRGA